MANSFMWLVAHGRPATSERLKSKGMVGKTRCPSFERGGRLNLLHILFQKGLNPFGGSGPLINWPDESSYIRKLAFADWDKVGRKLMGKKNYDSLDQWYRLKSVVCWSIWKMQERSASRVKVQDVLLPFIAASVIFT